MVHPLYLLRVAGVPSNVMTQTETGTSIALYREQSQLSEIIDAKKAQLCDNLAGYLPGIENTTDSRDLLTVKRAIFNRKRIKSSLVSKVMKLLSVADSNALNQYVNDIEQFHNLKALMDEQYQLEMKQTSSTLASLWQQPNLQQAMSYSQPQLWSEFNAIFGPEKKQIKAKKRRVQEDTLIQYISRTATKTSPLSAFTTIHCNNWSSQTNTSVNITITDTIVNTATIKTGLLQQILSALLMRFDYIKNEVKLQWNPSTQFENNKIIFTRITAGNISSGKTWGTGEERAEVAINPVISLILHLYQSENYSPLTLAELVSKIHTKAPKLTHENIANFIEKLFQLGLLTVAIEHFEQDDPLIFASQICECLSTPENHQAQEIINTIRSSLKSFTEAAPSARVKQHHTISQSIQQLSELLSAPVKEEMAKPIFFENTYSPVSTNQLNISALAPLANDFERLLTLAPILDSQQKLSTQLADFFVSRYGINGECKDCISFLNEFDEKFGVGRFGFQPEPSLKTLESATYRQFGEAYQALDSYLCDSLKQTENVQLNSKKLQDIIQLLPDAVNNRHRSHSFIGQLVQKGDELKYVLNQTFGGRSSLYSRFLENCSSQQLGQVKDYLRAGSTFGHYAEIPGVFGFNANRHPAMADHEIVIPPYPSHYAGTQKLNISELTMVFDQHTHKVYFKDKQQQLFDLWYQGFLIPMLMPRLMRVLALTNGEGVNQYTLGVINNHKLVDTANITRFPRITLGNIIISRRMTIIPRHLLPDESLSDVNYFFALQDVIKSLGLHNEAFVRVAPIDVEMTDEKGQPIDWNTFNFKNSKPFYVKFDNPRLVRLFLKKIKRNHFPVTVSEVLPELNDTHVAINEAPHIAELHIELTQLAKGERQ